MDQRLHSHQQVPVIAGILKDKFGWLLSEKILMSRNQIKIFLLKVQDNEYLIVNENYEDQILN